VAVVAAAAVVVAAAPRIALAGMRRAGGGVTAKAVAIALTLPAALAVAAVPSAARDARRTTISGLRLVRGRVAELPRLTDQQRFTVVAPAARAVNVNTAVPKFEFFFNYNVVHHGKLQITAQFISPFFASFEQIDGGCVACTGPGRFQPFTVKHNTWRENVRGKLYMTGKTKIVQAIFSAGEIGRFKVYGLTLRQTVAPVRLAEGCIPADLQLSFAQLRDYKTMPKVPCQEQLPVGDSIQLGAPVELSATSGSPVSISGHAGEPEWLTVFQAPLDSKSPCAVNALSEALRTPNFISARVSGNFSGKFSAATASKPGYLCAYLQTGGRIKVTTGGVLPDGRVSATTDWFFLAGDVVNISGPTTATAGPMFTETFSGIAQVPEQLYVFAPNSPCATTAQAEYGVDPLDFTTAEQAGAFNTPVTITVSNTPPPVQYICAYTQYGPPSNGVPTGPTLAANSTTITIG
jgi:hypothetical protein